MAAVTINEVNMDLSKSFEFFQPSMCDGRIHIIGCGSVGSTLAELLVRYGLTDITLYDFDTVEAHNIANQMFISTDIGKEKVTAVADHLVEINPDIKDHLRIADKGYTNQKLNGYVFLCVDNIDLRRQIVETNKNNNFIKAMFDFRTRLTDAQHYAADWNNEKHKEAFLGSMQFSHEEASKETPMSACHVTLSVAATVRLIVTYGVVNFIDFLKKGTLKKVVLINTELWDLVGI